MQEQQIIKIDFSNEQFSVSGRELYMSLKVETRYDIWVSRMLEYGFIENEDYLLVVQKRTTNNPKNPITQYINHMLTLDMAKELCMLQRNEIGRTIRKYFIAAEKEYRFLLTDKEHQKACMTELKERLKPQGKVSYIKANTIVDKAVSNKYGFPKMIKKGDMPPEMLKEREQILEDTVKLMSSIAEFDLNISVSDKIYSRIKQITC